MPPLLFDSLPHYVLWKLASAADTPSVCIPSSYALLPAQWNTLVFCLVLLHLLYASSVVFLWCGAPLGLAIKLQDSSVSLGCVSRC